ncbi:TIGR03085 family metal-binding protein [Nostocoides sp. F2B08]|uniref:TIGR03085 family metal-binding protein n=1 Tax=Nostocoides sp. F2B08 TaxID=2653936 RepID=UPI00186AE748|nr:TIGR03085 family metal-binding protein [Tetrasphaera sp. F2B08]
MPTRAVAAAERSALCDTLLEVGPDAPTLCSPWRTRDLAAHLVLREHRPDLVVAAHLPGVSDRLEREQNELATATPWPELVERVRSGPPAWHPTQIAAVDDAVNTLEFFIHHEDILRAGDPSVVRELSEETAQGVWTALKRTAKLLFRKVDAGLVLAAPGYGRIAVKAPSRRGSVTVTAAPGELALLGFGRATHAHFDARGSKAAVTALQTAPLGV